MIGVTRLRYHGREDNDVLNGMKHDARSNFVLTEISDILRLGLLLVDAGS